MTSDATDGQILDFETDKNISIYLFYLKSYWVSFLKIVPCKSIMTYRCQASVLEGVIPNPFKAPLKGYCLHSTYFYWISCLQMEADDVHEERLRVETLQDYEGQAIVIKDLCKVYPAQVPPLLFPTV